MMKVIGNIIWLLFGGFMIAIEYFLGGLLLIFTIIGIPFGFQSIKLGLFALWPFGSRVTTIEDSFGCFNWVMNIIWIIVAGFWIALTHLFWGILLCITIIGIPFGRQHFKLMKLALFPFGKEVVSV